MINLFFLFILRGCSKQNIDQILFNNIDYKNIKLRLIKALDPQVWSSQKSWCYSIFRIVTLPNFWRPRQAFLERDYWFFNSFGDRRSRSGSSWSLILSILITSNLIIFICVSKRIKRILQTQYQRNQTHLSNRISQGLKVSYKHNINGSNAFQEHNIKRIL